MSNNMYYDNEQWRKAILLFEEISPYIKPHPAVLLGDSHLQFFRASEFIPEKYFVNRGIDGDITTGVLQRLKSSVFNINAAKVFLLIGSNDLPIHSDEKMLANYKEILISIISNLPACEINIISLFPTRHINDHPNTRIMQINLGLEQLARDFDINYINIHPLLCDENNELKKEYTYDGLHLNQIGYNLFSKFIKNHL